MGFETSQSQVVFPNASSGGGGGLPVAAAADEIPASTGPGTTYTARTPSQVRGIVGLPTAFTTPGAYLRVNSTATAYEEFMAFVAGHSWDQATAATAGAGAQFFNVDNGVLSVSSGDNTTGWYVEFGGPNLRDTCALQTSTGYVRTTANLTAFTLDATTLAVLFRWDGDTGHPYYFFGSLGSRPRGLIPALNSSGADWKLVIYQGSDVTLTTMTTIPKASFATGWHALSIAPVLHDFGGGLVEALAWSLDGSVVDYVAMAIPYTAPGATDALVAANDDVVDMPFNGAVAELAAWTSTLTGAQMAALSAVPATPTCKLPITSAMGVPYAWIQALRYDPRLPTECLVKIGSINVAAVASAVVREEF